MILLQTQRTLASEIQQQVLKGNLEEAGIGVLGLLPQIGNGCNTVLQDLAETDSKKLIKGIKEKLEWSRKRLWLCSHAIGWRADGGERSFWCFGAYDQYSGRL